MYLKFVTEISGNVHTTQHLKDMGKGEVVTRGIKNVELCKPHKFDNPCSYQSFNFDLELRGMRYISRRRSGRKRRFRGDIGHYVHGYPYFPVQAERRVQYMLHSSSNVPL